MRKEEATIIYTTPGLLRSVAARLEDKWRCVEVGDEVPVVKEYCKNGHQIYFVIEQSEYNTELRRERRVSNDLR